MTDETGRPPRKRGRPRRSQAHISDGNAEPINIGNISGTLGPQIGAKLRQVRTLRGLTQQDLAQDTFSKSYVSAIEHGKIKPSLRALVYLAERLNTPIAYFLDAHGDEPTNPPPDPFTILSNNPDAELMLAEAAHQAAAAHPAVALSFLTTMDTSGLAQAQQLRHYLLVAEVNITLKDTLTAQMALQQARELMQIGNIETTRYKLEVLVCANDAAAGRVEAAVRGYQQLVPLIDDGTIKDLSLQMAIHSGLGDALRKLGRADEAVAAYRNALATAQQHQNLEQLSAALWQLSDHYRQMGQLEEALSYATRSLTLSEASDDICRVVDINTNLAQISQQAQRWDEARAYLEAALTMAERLGNDRSCAETLDSLTRLVFKAGASTAEHIAQAADYANRALDKAQRVGDGELIGKTRALVGMVQNAEGRLEDSDNSYAAAFAQLKQVNSDGALGDTYFEYAQILRKRGDNAGAGDYLQQAYLLRQH